jgi:hypothetical protein
MGKSSTLAWLALQGHPVLCDDVLVVAGGSACAGPRAVDLRADAADALGCGEPVGRLGGRERWRLRLPPVEAAVPLRGWIFLGWGDDVSIEPLPASERLVQLAGQRSMRRPPVDPAALLALAQLPAFALRRPRGMTSIAAAADALLATVRR